MALDGLKNRVRFSTTLTPETEKALKEYSVRTDIPISKIVDKAIAQYIEGNKKDSGGA